MLQFASVTIDSRVGTQASSTASSIPSDFIDLILDRLMARHLSLSRHNVFTSPLQKGQHMQGSVVEFVSASNSGAINGDDGRRYEFKTADWQIPCTPTTGIKVDFATEGATARHIYRTATPSSGSVFSQIAAIRSGEMPRRDLAVLDAIFLGAFGTHKFYLGLKPQGLTMLLITILGAILILPPLTMQLLAMVEAFCFALKSDDEFRRVYVYGKRRRL